jgi:hypothetical protein
MNDDFEDLLKRWLRERAGSDRSVLQALAGNVAAFPPRRRRQPSQLAAAAAVILALGLAAFALAPRFNSGTGEASPAPPDPAAFAGDPRLARCGATVDTAIAAFEMSHARDYRLHLPAMLLAPELDVEAPAFVVVYRGMSPIPRLGGAPPPGQTWQPRSLEPGRHDVCVLVGTDLATAEMSVYSDVDTSGLTVDVASIGPSDSTEPSGLEATPATVSPPVTPEPAPSWAADITGQLECDGAVANLGMEVSESDIPETLGDTPETALAVFLGPTNPYSTLPAAGFSQLHREPHWASFAHVVGGRAKAIIVLSDATASGPRWAVVGLRACDASEFDPTVPLTWPLTIWSDVSGVRISTRTIVSVSGPAHCGQESAVFLSVDGNLYFHDPNNVMAAWTSTRFDSNAQLPGRAKDTGYRSGKWSLWLDPGGDAYLVTHGRVERWPRSTDPQIVCE